MRFIIYILGLFSVILILGCSYDNTPVTLDPGGRMKSISIPDAVGLLVEEYDSTSAPKSGYGALGIFHGFINPSKLTGDLVSLRSSTIDDTLEVVDITNFLKLAPCTNCVKIKSIELDVDGHLVVKIGIKHPFPAGNPLNPITGRNRADLHVFNIEGTVIFEDSITNISFPGIGKSIGPNYLLNADGYSPYLDIVLDDIYPTIASVHPYILHFNDYSAGNFDPVNPTGFESVTDPPPTGNLVMAMGCDYDFKDYIFNVPSDTSFEFIYAIGCTYALSAASKGQRFTPEYQIPQHNKKAASEVSVEIVSNDLKGDNTSSSANLMIKVLDINHGVAVGSNLNEMKAASSVSVIMVEIPGVTNGIVTGPTTPTGGNGRDPLYPLTFPVTIFNSLGADEGTYIGMVKVLDSYAPGQNVASTLDGKDGIKRANPGVAPTEGLFGIPEFATYIVFEIDVATGNTPPTAALSPANINICKNVKVNFDASGSSDLEDDIAMIPLKFEFDFDYNGTTFTSDTGAPSTTPTALSTPYAAGGPYTAAVRVTDSGGLTGIATAMVTISDNSTPISSVIDITDGVAIQGTRYYHTTQSLQSVPSFRDWSHGMEGTAFGNGYIYLTFYTGAGNLYFTRSADSGLTWDAPVVLASGVPNLGAASIAAAGSEVFIIYANTTGGDVFLTKNINSGNGTWDKYTVGSYGAITIANLSVGVDPTNTNYVYATMTRSSVVATYSVYLLNNSTGGSGAWNEQNRATPAGANAYNYEIAVNSDGRVYALFIANYIVGAIRSDDHGVTYTPWVVGANCIAPDSNNYVWGVDGDICFDPSDPNKVFIVWALVGNTIPIFLKRLALLRSDNSANNFTLVQSSLAQTPDWPARQPAVVKGINGKLYVVYAYQTTASDFDIFVRVSCDDGVTFQAPFQINTDDDGIDADPELVIATDGSVVLTWEDNGYASFVNDNPAGKIVARKLM